MDWQKVAVDGQNKENRLNDFHEWIVLQNNKKKLKKPKFLTENKRK